jgi:hypothetical protein
MEVATTETVQGVTLEAISAPDLPDTESLLGQLGTMYPILTYAPTEAPAGAEQPGREDAGDVADGRRDELDASIMAGLLWP